MLPSDVTVLLPARNAASAVVDAVRSTLADLAEGRLLVVDDASTDGTRALLEEVAHSDGRIQVVDGPGLGIASALEVGRKHIRTPLIARMDADDIWLPGRLHAQLRALEGEPRLAVVGGAVELFGDPPLGPGMLRYVEWLSRCRSPEELHRERYVESPLVHPAVLMRAEAVAEVGGYRGGSFPEDYDLWLRLIAGAWRVANVPEKVLRWRDSPLRLTRSHPHYSPEAHRALKVEHLLREPWLAKPILMAGAGRTGLPLARELRAGGATVERFVEVHPRKVGTSIEGIPVIGYDALGLPSGRHLLVAVGIPSARQQVREFLPGCGWEEGRDFTCVA